MKILKFGGTSVGSPGRMRSLMDIIDKEEKQIIVLSAVAGTTNNLVEINESYRTDKVKTNLLIQNLKSAYQIFIKDLFPKQEFLSKASGVIDKCFARIECFLNSENFTNVSERIILAQGEIISTNLFSIYLEQTGIKSCLLSALDFMKTDRDGEPDIPFIKEHIMPGINSNSEINLFITQGFICRNSFGETDNLKRGGSDYSASLIGAAIGAEVVEIWTDIDGMHNNDPRIVKNTKPIDHLSFDEAAELAYFGAKILHPQCVLPAQKYNIPIRVKHSMNPDAQGTFINFERIEGGIKAVAAKDGITAIKIQSSRMLMAYGFLRRLFEVFERYMTPIDMIATSEVAVSLTIDNPCSLKEIKEELQKFGTVEVDRDLTIICIVGDFLSSKSEYCSRIINALKDIPVRMISYGGSSNNISLLIDSAYKHKALNDLHNSFF